MLLRSLGARLARPKWLRWLLLGVTLALAGVGATALALTLRGHTARVPQVYDFVAHYATAEVQSPGPEYAGVIDYFVARDVAERVLYAHPDTQITYRGVPVYEGGRLELGIAMQRDTWATSSDGVTFEVTLVDAGGQAHPVFSQHLDPAHNEADRGWQPAAIDLAAFAGQQVDLTFATRSGGNPAYDWAAWSQPRLLSDRVVPVGRENQPNVILVSIDTLRADHLSAYGYEQPTSPHLDALAEEGVLFEQAYSQVIVTTPEHTTMLTSLYARTHGIYSNSTGPLSPDVRTLAEVLQQEGYGTAAAVGVKFLMPEYTGLGQGFDDFFPFPDEIENWKYLRPAAEVTALSKAWIEEHYRDKFFLFVHYYDVHSPFAPEEPYTATQFYQGDPGDPNNHSLDGVDIDQRHDAGVADGITDLAYAQALYDAEIAYTDNALGELFAFLDLLELSDNTLVIVVSDHGESFGEHGIYFDHWTLYDDTFHVPLIMRYPGHLPAGQRVASLVEAGVDLVPTILELLNLPPMAEAEGQSLVPLVKGHQEPRTAVFGEMRAALAVAIRTDKYKFILDRITYDNAILRYTPVVEGDRELYDLTRDPGEFDNLLATPGAFEKLRDEFTTLCQRWLEQRSVQVTPVEEELPADLKEMLDDLGY